MNTPENKKSYMLNIGEVKVVKSNDEILWTVLGSCISVIFHKKGKLSIICHAQMPSRGKFDRSCSDNCPHPCFNNLSESNDFKYVNCSLEYMMDMLKKNRINFQEIHTTLIGGAAVLQTDNIEKTIGYQNIQVAKNILANNQIKINRELSGGNTGLTLWYYHDDNRLVYRDHNSKDKLELH